MNGTKTLRHIILTIFVVSIVATSIFLTRHLAESATPRDVTIELTLEDLSLLDKFTSSDKVRMQEIIGRVMSDPEYMTSEIRKDFWTIMRGAHGLPPTEVVQTVRGFIIETMVKAQRYFWEDALLALKNQRPHKSVQRERLEKKFVKANLLPEWRVQKNEELIEQIAARRPIQIREEKIVFDEKRITAILGNIEKAAQRVEVLLTPP